MDLFCYCINLESDTRRREHCSTQYEEAGLSYEFVKATDGRTTPVAIPQPLSTEEAKRWEDVDRAALQFGFFNRGMNSAEHACALSHYRVWEVISQKPEGWYMVNEDDFKLHEIQTLPSILDAIQGSSFDMVYLGYRGGRMDDPSFKEHLQRTWHAIKWSISKRDIIATSRRNAVRFAHHKTTSSAQLLRSGMTWGGHAYCLTPAGARALMTTNRNLRFLPDEALRFAILEGIISAGCSSSKPFACEEEFGSHLRSGEDHASHHQQFPSQ